MFCVREPQKLTLCSKGKRNIQVENRNPIKLRPSKSLKGRLGCPVMTKYDLPRTVLTYNTVYR